MIKGKGFKKVLASLAAGLMMFGSSTVPIHADTTITNAGFSGYWFRGSAGQFATGDSAPVDILSADGTPAYCIQPTLLVNTGGAVYQTSTLDSYNALTAPQKARIAEISYYGYGYPGRTDGTWFAAAQKAIWQTINGGYSGVRVYAGGSATFADFGSMTEVTADINNKINSIMTDVNAYEASLGTPNYVIKDSSGNAVGTSGQNASYDKGIVGKTYTVTDTNGVLASQVVTKNTFDNASVSGNTITIKLSKADLNQNHTIYARGNYAHAWVIARRPIICQYPNAQNLVAAGSLNDPSSGSITLNAIGVSYDFNKVSKNGMVAVEGAKLGVYEDTNGDGIHQDSEPKVDEWTSDATGKHTVDGLIPDTKYVYHENQAPKGHLTAADMGFTAKMPADGQTTNDSVTMVDDFYTVVVRKNTQKNERIADITLTIIDKETGKTATDVKGNEAVTKTLADKDWDVSNFLEAGKTYTLQETEAVGGVFKSTDIDFVAPKDKSSIAVTMVDQTYTVKVKKIDDTADKNLVPDVTLTLYDVTNGAETKVTEWKTGTEEWTDVTKYTLAGHKYILRETETADGYYQSKDINIDIPENYNDGDTTEFTVEMVDKVQNITFAKVDETGAYVSGAKYQILNEEQEKAVLAKQAEDEKNTGTGTSTGTGTPSVAPVKGVDYVYQLVSGTEPTATDENGDEIKLDATQTYYLHEVTAPFGYDLNKEDVKFNVTGTLEEPQVVTSTDNRKVFYASVTKTDINDDSLKLSGAEFTVYDAVTDEVAKTADGLDAVGKTDENGNYVFKLFFNPNGYYVKETSAPEGYLLNDDKFDLTLSEDYDFAKENPVNVKVADTLAPVENHKTGEGINSGAIAGGAVGVAVIAGGAAFLLKKKKEDGSEEPESKSDSDKKAE